MIPRKRLDIRWSDLAFGLAKCVAPPDGDEVERRLERTWSADRPVPATLSVRTGFDLILRLLALPPGSEIAVSAVTIRDMIRIIEHHGLRAVPVDVDLDTGAPNIEALERAISERTRGILVAHLFGGRTEMTPMVDVARRRGLYVFEDCAQAFAADDYRGHPEADVAMFSFGPIKTATALGGALLTFREAEFRDRARALERRYPVQATRRYALRILKYAVLKGLSYRLPYTLLVGLCRLAGTSHDQVLGNAVRGFAGGDLIPGIRRRPCAPLLAVIERRLRTYAPERIASRIAGAEFVAERLGDVAVVGRYAPDHAHWVFPVLSRRPEALIEHLERRGFDATRGASSLSAVPPSDFEGLPAPEAERMLDGIVYLPVDAGATEGELVALADAVRTFESTRVGATLAAGI